MSGKNIYAIEKNVFASQTEWSCRKIMKKFNGRSAQVDTERLTSFVIKATLDWETRSTHRKPSNQYSVAVAVEYSPTV